MRMFVWICHFWLYQISCIPYLTKTAKSTDAKKSRGGSPAEKTSYQGRYAVINKEESSSSGDEEEGEDETESSEGSEEDDQVDVLGIQSLAAFIKFLNS